MSIVDPHFTMPGADMPPQEFKDLKTQQGQINWLAQFAMRINNSFEGQWDATAESLPYTDEATVSVTPSKDGLTFNFGIPRGAPYDDQVAFAFDTVAQMQANADNLGAGMLVLTAGFYTAGDGGGALYKISESGTANGMDVIECGNLRAHLIVDGALNALQIGMKNDNSLDCAPIINYATGKYDIYFPAGNYKIASTVNLVRAIFSNAYVREPSNAEKMTAVFTSAIEDDSPILSVNSNPVYIHNIAIRCNGNETAFTTSNYGISRILIDGLFIWNCNGIGLEFKPIISSFISRHFYVQNYTVFGVSGGNCIGICSYNSGSDSRIVNYEAMYVQKAFLFYGGTYFINNVHTWGGVSRNTSVDLAWLSESTGMDCRNSVHVIVTNYYTDTFLVHFKMGNNCTISVRNIIAMDDATVDYASFSRVSALVYETGRFTNIFNLDGGYIRLDVLNRICNFSESYKFKIENVTIVNNVSEYVPEAIRYPFSTKTVGIKQAITETSIIPICFIYLPRSSKAVLTMTNYEFEVQITITNVNGTITTTKTGSLGGGNEIGYLKYNNMLIIYVRWVAGTNVYPISCTLNSETMLLVDNKNYMTNNSVINYNPIPVTNLPEGYTVI